MDLNWSNRRSYPPANFDTTAFLPGTNFQGDPWQHLPEVEAGGVSWFEEQSVRLPHAQPAQSERQNKRKGERKKVHVERFPKRIPSKEQEWLIPVILHCPQLPACTSARLLWLPFPGQPGWKWATIPSVPWCPASRTLSCTLSHKSGQLSNSCERWASSWRCCWLLSDFPGLHRALHQVIWSPCGDLQYSASCPGFIVHFTPSDSSSARCIQSNVQNTEDDSGHRAGLYHMLVTLLHSAALGCLGPKPTGSRWVHQLSL